MHHARIQGQVKIYFSDGGQPAEKGVVLFQSPKRLHHDYLIRILAEGLPFGIFPTPLGLPGLEIQAAEQLEPLPPAAEPILAPGPTQSCRSCGLLGKWIGVTHFNVVSMLPPRSKQVITKLCASLVRVVKSR